MAVRYLEILYKISMVPPHFQTDCCNSWLAYSFFFYALCFFYSLLLRFLEFCISQQVVFSPYSSVSTFSYFPLHIMCYRMSWHPVILCPYSSRHVTNFSVIIIIIIIIIIREGRSFSVPGSFGASAVLQCCLITRHSAPSPPLTARTDDLYPILCRLNF